MNRELANWATTMAIGAMLLSIGFIGGSIYDSRITTPIISELRAEIDMIKTKQIQAKHGPRYHYFTISGRMYYVKDNKDLENKKKWIRVR